uniref:Phage Tail Collar Domain n=1 Tax=Candidatus Kentrum sp. LPFa TaxID=2126335 RepID=A0A450X7D6_9GAMM|nr:MAG: hypothetical protein BECKLPF1236B_GA0070989_14642 [Candidatus Kentron sp. LPFa]
MGTGADQVARGDHLHDARYYLSTKKFIECLESGDPLPGSDAGPIFHPDYPDILTWQTFGAWSGYATTRIGSYLWDSADWWRPGYVQTGVTNLSMTTYAALWHWALSRGRVVALGSWAAGYLLFADNGDGTFRTPNLQGLFPRVWPGGVYDPGRGLGSLQGDAIRNIHGSIAFGELFGANPLMCTLANGAFNTTATTAYFAGGNGGGTYTRNMYANLNAANQVPTAGENRPVNTSLPLYLCAE